MHKVFNVISYIDNLVHINVFDRSGPRVSGRELGIQYLNNVNVILPIMNLQMNHFDVIKSVHPFEVINHFEVMKNHIDGIYFD